MPWSTSRPKSAQYGWDWQKTRAAWAARHQPWHRCTRCHHPLGPMGPHLHLDHDDHDRTVVRGFAHGTPCPICRVRCNVRAGAVKARRQQTRSRLRW